MTERIVPVIVGLLACACLVVALGIVPAGVGTVAAAENDTNETDRPIHEHPDEIDEDGDEDALAGFLENRLADRLGDHAIAVSEGEYERAQDILGEDYEGDLGRFAELEEDLDDDDEESTSDEFEETAERQEEYAELLEEYERLQAEYEAAREAGDEERAREIGRELVDLAERLEALGVDLEQRYVWLDERTVIDFDPARESVAETTDSVVVFADEVREIEFDPVSVEADADAEVVSYLDPVTVSVVVTDENDTAIDGGAVELDAGEDGSTTAAVENGTATLTYRPTLVAPGEYDRSISYDPEPDSVYLGNATSVPLTVEAVEGSLTIDDLPETVAYGDRITVRTTVSVDGEPVRSFPVRGTVAGDDASATTGEDGDATLAWSVDETTPAGDLPVSVSGSENRAIGFEGTTRSVTVEPTDSSLDLVATPETADDEPADDLETADRITAEVTLRTADGDPVYTSVDLFVGGESVRTVTTDENGTATVALPLPEPPGETAVEARFDPDGGALEPATAEGTVVLDPAPGDGLLSGLPGAAAVLVGVLVLAAAIVGSLVYQRRGDDPDAGGTGAAVDAPPDSTDDTSSERTPVRSRLEDAADRLSAADHDGATVLAYGAAREAIVERTDVDDRQTHWAFYRDCRDDGLDPEGVESLETLTERYERAAFAPDPVDPDEAAEAVERAEAVVDPSVEPDADSDRAS